MDVSQSAMDYHDADVSDESGMGAKLRSMAVQPERMDFATMPRPSAKNQENIQSIMAGNGLSPSQLASLDAAASAIASAIEQMSLVDTGKPMVVQFRAA